MLKLKLKRLSDFIDDMIQKYQIEETKNLKKKFAYKISKRTGSYGGMGKS